MSPEWPGLLFVVVVVNQLASHQRHEDAPRDVLRAFEYDYSHGFVGRSSGLTDGLRWCHAGLPHALLSLETAFSSVPRTGLLPAKTGVSSGPKTNLMGYYYG